MKLRLSVFGLMLCLCMPAWAQPEIDVTQLTADEKSFIFSDNKSTVKGYIYAELEAKTACCGNDRIYLEVKIDPSGYVLSAKTLTGKNECFKQSAIDIVKNVKWTAKDFKGPKSIYFEIKPNVDCDANRTNTYAQVEVFNNELLDENGNRVYDAEAGAVRPQSPPVAATPPPSQPEPTPAQPEPTPQTPPARTQPEPSPSEPVATAQPPAAQPEPSPTPPPTRAQPQEDPVRSQPMTSAPAMEPSTEKPLTEEEMAIRKQEDEDLARKQSEIERLREQMARMRAEEEKAFERKRAAEMAQRERERQESLAQEEASASSGEGGLFLDGKPDDWNGTDPLPAESTAMGDPDPNQPVEDQVRERIRMLEEQQREIIAQRETRQREAQRQLDENERDNRQLMQLEEERLQMEEELAQSQEQRELDMLRQDLQRAEDSRREQELEHQRIMDEIARLQQEAQNKISDLERQKEDLDEISARQQLREEQIMLERTKRKLEQERRIEEFRLSTLSTTRNMGSDFSANSNPNPTPTGSAGSMTEELLADLSTKADSEKLKILIQYIENLERELKILNQRLITMEGGTPQPSGTSPANPNSRGTIPPPPAGVSNAATDESWKKLDDIYAPGTDPSKYIVQSAPSVPSSADPTATGDQARGDRSPDPSHKDTHENMAGPELKARYYVDGRDALKNTIKSKLQSGGVCGLAHTVFSVTLDPQGNVVDHQVLAANSTLVQIQMSAIIPQLKFNRIDGRYRQTVYQEIKAEINCSGTETNVDLKDVKDIIKEGQ